MKTLTIINVSGSYIECVKIKGFKDNNIFISLDENELNIYDYRTGLKIATCDIDFQFRKVTEKLLIETLHGFNNLAINIVPLRDFLLKQFCEMEMKDELCYVTKMIPLKTFHKFCADSQP